MQETNASVKIDSESEEEDEAGVKTEHKEYPVATLDDIRADTKRTIKDYIIYQGKRIDFECHTVPSGKRKEIRKKAIIESEDNTDYEEYLFRDLMIDEMMETILGQNWKTFSETQLDGGVYEALREYLFRDSPMFRIPAGMQKKLVKELKDSAQPYMEEQIRKGKRRRKY